MAVTVQGVPEKVARCEVEGFMCVLRVKAGTTRGGTFPIHTLQSTGPKRYTRGERQKKRQKKKESRVCIEVNSFVFDATYQVPRHITSLIALDLSAHLPLHPSS